MPTDDAPFTTTRAEVFALLAEAEQRATANALAWAVGIAEEAALKLRVQA